ncbi:MAG TPA: hypothetical protein VFP84_11230 [Kofleriaceae bacterium]|nr:hypothetical protein [Kofleriaceae bacterium]
MRLRLPRRATRDAMRGRAALFAATRAAPAAEIVCRDARRDAPRGRGAVCRDATRPAAEALSAATRDAPAVEALSAVTRAVPAVEALSAVTRDATRGGVNTAALPR